MNKENCKVKVNEIITLQNGGGFYNITGNLMNGYLVAEVELGEVKPNLYQITRRVRSVDLENNKLYCECGRVFNIDNDLTLTKCNY